MAVIAETRAFWWTLRWKTAFLSVFKKGLLEVNIRFKACVPILDDMMMCLREERARCREMLESRNVLF